MKITKKPPGLAILFLHIPVSQTLEKHTPVFPKFGKNKLQKKAVFQSLENGANGFLSLGVFTWRE